MYAVVEQGGNQYKVAQGDVLNIDLMDVADDAKGVELDKVLMISDGKDITVGTPYVDGAKVVCKFDGSADDAVVKGEKLYPMHFRRRKSSQKRIGHRQKYLRVTVESIVA